VLRALLHLKRGRRAVCVVLDVCDIVRKKREISTLMFTALILGRCERIDTSKVRMHAGRERDAQHFLPPRHKPLDGCKIYNCLSAEDELPGSLTLFFPHAASRSPCSVWVHGKTLAYFAACRRPIKSKRHVPDLHRASFWFFCPDSVCV